MKSVLLLLAGCLTTTVGFAQSKPTLVLLQGKWQSTTDKTNFLVFEQNQRKEMAGGMKGWDSEAFILSATCQNASDKDKQQAEQGRYLSVPGSDLCWYIETLTATQLTLAYTGRGNLLTYHRVVVVKKPVKRAAK